MHGLFSEVGFDVCKRYYLQMTHNELEGMTLNGMLMCPAVLECTILSSWIRDEPPDYAQKMTEYYKSDFTEIHRSVQTVASPPLPAWTDADEVNGPVCLEEVL